jgi:6-phosphogluconolactonase
MTRNSKNKVSIFRTSDALNQAAAQFVSDLAGKSVLARGRFSVCLSGGDTPKGLYTLLSMNPYHDLIPWEKTFIFWGDERCVPQDDEDNNAHMAMKALLNKIDVPASNIFPIPVNLPPADAAIQYEQTLKNFFGKEEPRFDLILLGLGENGHTASLFPGTKVLHEKSHWVKEVFVADKQVYRITMTALLINKAHHILFMVTGAYKSAILKTVLSASLQPEKYPVQLIKPEQGEAYWLADALAASGLPDEIATRT